MIKVEWRYHVLSIYSSHSFRSDIETLFREKVEKDTRVTNAFLLVHSQDIPLHSNIAEGFTGDRLSTPHQPNYMASVGKLFSSILTSLLYEKGALSFKDPIRGYLDEDQMDGLHFY